MANATSTKSVDVVAVYTQSFQQLFPFANPMKAIVKEESKLMEHPLENGAIVTDHRIILQTEIELPLILTSATYKATYTEIKQLFLSGTVLVVQTNAGVYGNQVIQSMPHEEDPARFNTLSLNLHLKQIQVVSPVTVPIPKNPTNTGTVKRGNVLSAPASTQRTTSAARELFNSGLSRK